MRPISAQGQSDIGPIVILIRDWCDTDTRLHIWCIDFVVTARMQCVQSPASEQGSIKAEALIASPYKATSGAHINN